MAQPPNPDAAGDAQGNSPDAAGDAAQGGGQGGIAETLIAVDQQLNAIVKATAKANVPDEVKQAFATAQQAYRSGLEALNQAAGGGAPGGDQPSGPVSAEGGPRGVPMSQGRPS